jgi:serine/threonine-protein kinase/endoribonuclease IRE1
MQILIFKNGHKNSPIFRYYALELCQASLNQLFFEEEDAKKYRGPMPPTNDVLYQLASGLNHIHSKGRFHRDIKPENVLIWVSPDKEKVLMKWADFGLSKQVNDNGSCEMSGNRGTHGWRAPEMLNIQIGDRRSVESDIFAEGIVFGYFLLKGQHPFEYDDSEINSNIRNLKLDNVKSNKNLSLDVYTLKNILINLINQLFKCRNSADTNT